MRSSSPRRLCVEKPDCQGFQHAARKTRRRVLNLTPGISDNPCKVENQGEGAAGQTCNGCGGADRAETLLEVQSREGAGEPESRLWDAWCKLYRPELTIRQNPKYRPKKPKTPKNSVPECTGLFGVFRSLYTAAGCTANQISRSRWWTMDLVTDTGPPMRALMISEPTFSSSAFSTPPGW